MSAFVLKLIKPGMFIFKLPPTHLFWLGSDFVIVTLVFFTDIRLCGR